MERHILTGGIASEMIGEVSYLRVAQHAELEKLHDFTNWLTITEAERILNLFFVHGFIRCK